MHSSSRVRRIAVLTPLAFAMAVVSAQAATRVDLHGANLAQLKQQYSQGIAANGTPAMAHTRHEQLLRLDPQSRLVLMNRHDSHGVRNTRYQQTFRGIPVWGEQVIVSEDDSGNVRTLFGNKITGLASDLPARAFAGRAIAQAKALGLAKQAAFGAKLAATQVQRQKATKMIFVDDNGSAHLAWVVDMYAEGGGKPTRPQLIIDAHNGKVLKQWEGLTTANGTGPGGNQKTGQYEWGSGGIYGYLEVCDLRRPGRAGHDAEGDAPVLVGELAHRRRFDQHRSRVPREAVPRGSAVGCDRQVTDCDEEVLGTLDEQQPFEHRQHRVVVSFGEHERAPRDAQTDSERSFIRTVPADVADDRAHGAVGKLDRVEEVAADHAVAPTGPVPRGRNDARVVEQRAREKPSFQAEVLLAPELSREELARRVLVAVTLDRVPDGALEQRRVGLVLREVVLRAR